MKKSLVPIALALALIAVAPAAFAAGSATSTLTLNSSVAANCTIGAAALNFGAYDPVVANLSANLDGSTTMDVACTKGIAPIITTATAGGGMTGGGDTLNYLLFSNAGLTASFVTPGFTMPAATTPAAQTLTIYGRVPGGQNVGVAALYTGTITFTVNF